MGKYREYFLKADQENKKLLIHIEILNSSCKSLSKAYQDLEDNWYKLSSERDRLKLALENMLRDNDWASVLQARKALNHNESEKTYPCEICGELRTAAEGGTTFTVCDACWEDQYGKNKK